MFVIGIGVVEEQPVSHFIGCLCSMITSGYTLLDAFVFLVHKSGLDVEASE